ncbi:MAG: GNAT family N-acetyltransferase [Peptococcaceae bacterium]|nr:GNAT family N-acetyltransferase [Peptococcaceae bacterium]
MIQKIDAQTLTTLYEQEMTHTFPRAELKPLKAMLRMQAEGRYDVLGYYDDNGTLLAYACLCTAAEPVLLDYLAVVAAHRGEGLGSAFLSALMQEASPYPAIMLEIEAVDDALNEDDRAMRARRQRFYERLGFVRTTTEAHIFGEHYWVLDNQTTLGEHSAHTALTTIYRYMVPEEDAFARNVRIWDR